MLGMSWIDMQIEVAWKLCPAPGRYGIAVLPQGCAPILFLVGYGIPTPGEIAHMPPLLRRPCALDCSLHRQQIRRSTIIESSHPGFILRIARPAYAESTQPIRSFALHRSSRSVNCGGV